jgi:SAM-dependent methyltransferase
MDQTQRQRIVNRHRDSFKRYGLHPHALYWSSHEVQRTLFEVLLDIDVEEHSRVLDLGCGFGDLYGYFHEQGIEVDYTGIDLSPELISAGREHYPSAHFFEGDLFDFNPALQAYDYAFLSGALNEPFNDDGVYAKRIIKRLFDSCRKGVAFNLLDENHEWTAGRYDLQSFIPEEMAKWCRDFSPQVSLRHDYMENNFTLYLRRD